MTTLTTTAYGTTINWWHCNRCGELRRNLGNELPALYARVCATCKSDEDERRYQTAREAERLAEKEAA